MKIGEYRNPALVLFLIFITCGFYYLYLVYAVSQEIRDYQGRSDVTPGVEVLLTLLTCGFWGVYWDYRVGRRVGEMCLTADLPVTDNAWLYVILDLLGVGVINAVIQQDSLNRIWRAAGNNPPGNPYANGQYRGDPGIWPPPPGGTQP